MYTIHTISLPILFIHSNKSPLGDYMQSSHPFTPVHPHIPSIQLIWYTFASDSSIYSHRSLLGNFVQYSRSLTPVHPHSPSILMIRYTLYLIPSIHSHQSKSGKSIKSRYSLSWFHPYSPSILLTCLHISPLSWFNLGTHYHKSIHTDHPYYWYTFFF